MQEDFLDSFAPYDGEVCTSDAWPLPPVKPLDGKFDRMSGAAKDGFLTGLNPLACVRLVRGWLRG